ncbi:MAG TPA: adenylate cyclase [Desulfobulbaceae bacterium]|nr:MAG: adenylate cyclase [Deltaproteobacteria bacterium RIFOXYD12_FULL_53_23]HCC53397.1 adenylate cyclase [Desulfobulbaceae bacterium]
METNPETAANSFLQKQTRYKKYNEERKAKAVLFNTNQSNLLLKVIPFLLHSNYPDLPGFIDDADCPYGIHLFNPTAEFSHELFRRYFPNSTAMRTDRPSPFTNKPCIHSLKTIGSIGTIAQSTISDCDYWVSMYKKELGEKGRQLLQAKCRAIEEWTLKRGAEVHFFLMDIDQTRENNFESETDEESAGSAIKLLLKDELFRTHILVAGKMLLWWLIPPGLTEGEYRNFVQNIVLRNQLRANNFIDLGYLSDIPKAEIFGACLWQMNKALDSPFKSVIKLAYLELLLHVDTTTLPLFSDRVKCMVTYPEKLPAAEQGVMNLAEIDPYLLLARDIIAFYTQEKAAYKRASLIRECLFLKAFEGFDSKKYNKFGQTDPRKTTMDIMQNWHLLPEKFSHFLQFRDWKYKELITFGAEVHAYLIETYKRLRGIFKSFSNDTGLTITERDISVLGRKLFTFYEQKEDKIDYIRSVSRDLMAQHHITIHITKYEGVFHYYAFQGQHDHQTVKNNMDSVIKREDNLVRLIVWLLINGILAAKTQLHLTKNFLPIDLVDIQKLTELLLKTFPLIHFSHISPANLLKRETVLRALAIVNFDKTPVKGAKTLKSTMITENSYGEYFIQEYTTAIQLKNAMRNLLTQHYVSRWNNNLEIFIPPQDEQSYIKALIEG